MVEFTPPERFVFWCAKESFALVNAVNGESLSSKKDRIRRANGRSPPVRYPSVMLVFLRLVNMLSHSS